MPRQIYVNLPVEDLQRSVAFFTKLGFSFNPKFTNEHGTCMVIEENIFVMLLTKPFFQTFIANKEISNAAKHTEVLVTLTCDSKAQVDELVATAKAEGGTIFREAQDQGNMYQHAFTDLDGHIWELFYMDPNAEF